MTTTPPIAATDRLALIERARRLVATPERENLRAARQQRRRALDEYRRAMREMNPRHVAAMQTYQSAIYAEAAANRAEASELRELLAALVGVSNGGER